MVLFLNVDPMWFQSRAKVGNRLSQGIFKASQDSWMPKVVCFQLDYIAGCRKWYVFHGIIWMPTTHLKMRVFRKADAQKHMKMFVFYKTDAQKHLKTYVFFQTDAQNKQKMHVFYKRMRKSN